MVTEENKSKGTAVNILRCDHTVDIGEQCVLVLIFKNLSMCEYDDICQLLTSTYNYNTDDLITIHINNSQYTILALRDSIMLRYSLGYSYDDGCWGDDGHEIDVIESVSTELDKLREIHNIGKTRDDSTLSNYIGMNAIFANSWIPDENAVDIFNDNIHLVSKELDTDTIIYNIQFMRNGEQTIYIKFHILGEIIKPRNTI